MTTDSCNDAYPFLLFIGMMFLEKRKHQDKIGLLDVYIILTCTPIYTRMFAPLTVALALRTCHAKVCYHILKIFVVNPQKTHLRFGKNMQKPIYILPIVSPSLRTHAAPPPPLVYLNALNSAAAKNILPMPALAVKH